MLNEGTSGSQGNNKDPTRSGSLSSRLLPLPGAAARELGQLLTACLAGSGLPRPSKPLHAPVCRAEKGRAQPPRPSAALHSLEDTGRKELESTFIYSFLQEVFGISSFSAIPGSLAAAYNTVNEADTPSPRTTSPDLHKHQHQSGSAAGSSPPTWDPALQGLPSKS